MDWSPYGDADLVNLAGLPDLPDDVLPLIAAAKDRVNAAALVERQDRFDAVAAAIDAATAEAIFGYNPHTPPGQVGR